MAKILILETNQGHPKSELPEDLEYSSCVAKEIAPALRSLGHEVIEITKPTPADAANAIDTYNPDVIWHCGHGQVCITTLENVGTWMTHKSDSYSACTVDKYLQYAPNRFFSMLSCLAGSELGPRLITEGATAFMGYYKSFWFLICNGEGGTPCPCGRGLSDPDEIRGIKCPAQCDLKWLSALAEGKTVKEAYDSSQAKFQSEIEYWEGSTHGIAANVLYCLRLDKERQVALGDMDARIVTPTTTPAPTAPPPEDIMKCLFPRIYDGMPTPRMTNKEFTPRLNCIGEFFRTESRATLAKKYELISIIIPEHEDLEYIYPMLEQIKRTIPVPKEVIIVSSAPFLDIPNEYDFPITVIPNVTGTGEARNIGTQYAKGEILVYMDCHCCFLPTDIALMFEALKKNPHAIIVPGIAPYDFPVCHRIHTGAGYGLYYDLNMDLHWIGNPETNAPVQIPTQMTTFLMMRKETFEDSIFGFIECGGIGFDEEIEIRLWRFGHPTLVVPDVVIGHYFRPRRPSKEIPHIAQAMGLILNVFDDDLFNKINQTCYERRGGELWNAAMDVAYDKYGWARDAVKEKEVTKIDEHWFFRGE